MKRGSDNVEHQIETAEYDGGYGQAHKTARLENWLVRFHVTLSYFGKPND